MSIPYRSDVDGLRSIAVGIVFLFHYQFDFFSGGFVGVDVFFVISGYLITSIIYTQMIHEQFSFIQFFERRVRRLAPAMFLCCFFSGIVAYIFFLPLDFKEFGQSQTAAFSYMSNIYFWLTTGYFDLPAESKPLLHIWTLSVEEQFYIIWSIVLLVLLRLTLPIRNTFLFFLFFCSFIACVYLSYSSQSTAFYMIYTRFWEFLIGAALGLAFFPEIKSRLGGNFIGFFGLACILYASFMFDKENIFPGYIALLPCIGTAMIIHAKNSLISKLLSSKFLVYIGKRSYGLYLYHWPIFVFFSYVFVEMNALHTTMAILLSFVTCLLSYKYIEMPIRFSTILKGSLNAYIVFFISSLLAMLIGIIIHFNDGLKSRFSDAVYETYKLSNPNHINRKCHMKKDVDTFEVCLLGDTSKKPSFILLGDSHADALSPGFFLAAKENNLSGFQYTAPGYSPFLGLWNAGDKERIESLNNKLISLAKKHEIRKIYLAGYWNYVAGNEFIDTNGNAINGLQAITLGIQNLHKALPNVDIIVLTDVPASRYFGPEVEARSMISGVKHNQYILKADFLNERVGIVTAFQSLYNDSVILAVYDLGIKLCGDDKCFSKQQGKFLYRDNDHLSEYGSLELKDILSTVFDDEVSR